MWQMFEKICYKKSFLYLSQLRRHQLSHLNIREHECGQCSAKFVQKSHLETHIARKHAIIAVQVEATEARKVRADAERMAAGMGTTKTTSTVASTFTDSSSSSSDDCDSGSENDTDNQDTDEAIVNIQRSHQTDPEQASTSNPNKNNNLTEALSTTVLPKFVVTNPRKTVQCSECSAKFESKWHLKRHQNRNHTKWICWKCGQQFTSKSLFREHTDRHDTSRIHQCTICQRRFRRSTQLKTHEQSHSGKGTFLCVRCNAIFIQRTQLERHIARAHNSRRQCLSCTEDFSSIAQYCSHMRIIHAIITCGYCGAEIESDSKTHRERFHWRRLAKARVQTASHASHFTSQSQNSSRNIITNNEQEQKAMLKLVVLLDDHQSVVGDDDLIDVHKGFPPGLVEAFPALANLQIRVTDFVIDEVLKSIVLCFPIEADAENDPQIADFIHTPIFIDFRDN